jgi:hypothetical protein
MTPKGNQSGRRRAFTRAEKHTIRTMIRAGAPAAAVARRLNRPLWALHNRHEVAKLRHGVVYRRGEFARLFGVNDKTAVFWQERGWIPRRRDGSYAATQGQAARVRFRAWFQELEPAFTQARDEYTERYTPGKRAQYLITDADIEAFITNRETWVAWEVDWITDDAWRALAETVRAEADGHWLTAKAVEARYHKPANTVSRWHERGDFAGVRTVKYGSALFFWSTDLEGWTPPLERRYATRPIPRPGAPVIGRDGARPMGPLAERAIALVYAEHPNPISAPALAAHLGTDLTQANTLLRKFVSFGWLTRTVDPAKGSRYLYGIREE